MSAEEHYLKRELFELVKADDAIFEFLQQGVFGKFSGLTIRK